MIYKPSGKEKKWPNPPGVFFTMTDRPASPHDLPVPRKGPWDLFFSCYKDRKKLFSKFYTEPFQFGERAGALPSN